MKMLAAIFLCGDSGRSPGAACPAADHYRRISDPFRCEHGKVIYKKNENERRAVASTQKLLTALIIAESGDLSAPVTIDRSDMLAAPTKLYLKTGDHYTRQQLLTALLVKSPNDVARALARDNAGSMEDFAAQDEREDGSARRRFVPLCQSPMDSPRTINIRRRATWLAWPEPPISIRCCARSFERSIACSATPAGRPSPLQNTNRVLRTYAFCNGMKTGYTDAAGHCLISSGSWGGKDMIAVVLGSNKARVWQESALLLAYGLGINDTQMASLRVGASATADADE